jgi:hypothetical protein
MVTLCRSFGMILEIGQRKSFYSNLNMNILFERGFDTHCVWFCYAQCDQFTILFAFLELVL